MKETLKIAFWTVAVVVVFLLGRESRGDESSSSLPVKTPEPEVTTIVTPKPTEVVEADETEESATSEPIEVEESDETEELDETEEEAKPEKTKKEKKKKKQADAASNLPVVKKVDVGTVTLKDGNLQLWKKGKVLCSAQIPKALNPGDEYNGYYVDKNNRLVIIQTYLKNNGKFKMEYSILANNVAKVPYSISSDDPFEGYNPYIFQDKQGRYRLIKFVNRDALCYANFEFYNHGKLSPYAKAKSEATTLITKEIISQTHFFAFIACESGSSTLTVYKWKICLTLKKYGELCYTIYEAPSGGIEIDWKLYKKLTKKFPVKKYKEKVSELIQISKELEKQQKK